MFLEQVDRLVKEGAGAAGSASSGDSELRVALEEKEAMLTKLIDQSTLYS